MSFIEGVGDEVVAFVILVLVLILAASVTYLLNSTPFVSRSSIHTVETTSLERQWTGDSPQNRNNIISDDIEQEIGEAIHNEALLLIQEVINDESEISGNNASETSPAVNSENQEENQNSQTATEAVHHETATTEAASEGTARSSIYPNITEPETISGHVAEGSTVENEDRPSPGTNQPTIRLKYLNDTERSVTSPLTATIGDFTRTHFSEDLANNKVVRLIFSGQRLLENRTLQSYNIADNCVVHVQVLEAQLPNTATQAQNLDIDLSNLLWPLVSIILGLTWTFYLKYPDLFNFMSLGILALFTGTFVFFYSHIHLQWFQ